MGLATSLQGQSHGPHATNIQKKEALLRRASPVQTDPPTFSNAFRYEENYHFGYKTTFCMLPLVLRCIRALQDHNLK